VPGAVVSALAGQPVSALAGRAALAGQAAGSVLEALGRSGVDVAGLALAWARALPVVTIVPAFGLRAVVAPARPVMALALAASIVPALAPVAAVPGRPLLATALLEAARGVPVALAAAIPLWAATMAGGLADALRGAPEAPDMPTVEGRASPLGVLLSLLACTTFLAMGGPSRVALSLASPPSVDAPLLAAADALVAGIGLAIALGGPLLVAAVVVEVAAALVTRATAPTQVAAFIAPVRALAMLAVVALVLERLAAVMAHGMPAP
jgi:type III secretory pathway component EscT